MTHPFRAEFTAACTPPRFDIYAGIHKALRAMMMETLRATGCADVHDADELNAVYESVLALADTCATHLEHENEFIHPVMEASQAGSTAKIAAEHAQHLASLAHLCDAAAAMRICAPGIQREQAAMTLYRELALFVSENFAHMHAEEMEHNPVLWACYSDDELRALDGRIVASLPPDETLQVMRWMIPAMTPTERAMLLNGVKAAVPAPVFEVVLGTVQPHLSQKDWSQLRKALGSERENLALYADQTSA